MTACGARVPVRLLAQRPSPLRRQGPKFYEQPKRMQTWTPAFAGATVLRLT